MQQKEEFKQASSLVFLVQSGFPDELIVFYQSYEKTITSRLDCQLISECGHCASFPLLEHTISLSYVTSLSYHPH